MNEFTPRERGLLSGKAWLEARVSSVEDEAAVLDGEIPDRVREQVMAVPELRERLDASTDAEAEERFWEGFIHGARAHAVELQSHLGATDN